MVLIHSFCQQTMYFIGELCEVIFKVTTKNIPELLAMKEQSLNIFLWE